MDVVRRQKKVRAKMQLFLRMHCHILLICYSFGGFYLFHRTINTYRIMILPSMMQIIISVYGIQTMYRNKKSTLYRNRKVIVNVKVNKKVKVNVIYLFN